MRLGRVVGVPTLVARRMLKARDSLVARVVSSAEEARSAASEGANLIILEVQHHLACQTPSASAVQVSDLGMVREGFHVFKNTAGCQGSVYCSDKGEVSQGRSSAQQRRSRGAAEASRSSQCSPRPRTPALPQAQELMAPCLR